jgi:hypothetical protein
MSNIAKDVKMDSVYHLVIQKNVWSAMVNGDVYQLVKANNAKSVTMKVDVLINVIKINVKYV